MSVIIQDGKISIEAEDSYHDKKVVEFSLTENKRDIFVVEGCDYYFASKLNYEETTKLINGLKKMRSNLNTKDEEVKIITKKVSKNTIIKSLYESAEDLNRTLSDKDISKTYILDAITPIYLQLMNYLSDIEKHMVYAFVMRPRKVLNKTSEYITLHNLEKELSEPTKTLSVHAKKLVMYGILKVNTDNKKLFYYTIKDDLFKEWFKFRHKKPNTLMYDKK